MYNETARNEFHSFLEPRDRFRAVFHPFIDRLLTVYCPFLRFSNNGRDDEPHAVLQRPTNGSLYFWQDDSNRSTQRTQRNVPRVETSAAFANSCWIVLAAALIGICSGSPKEQTVTKWGVENWPKGSRRHAHKLPMRGAAAAGFSESCWRGWAP